MLLIFAAELKLYGWAHGYTDVRAVFVNEQVLLVVSLIEAALGAAMLSLLNPRLLRQIGIGTLVVFAGVALFLWQRRADSCGCLGPVVVAPKYMFAVDVLLTLLLWFARPAIRIPSVKEPPDVNAQTDVWKLTPCALIALWLLAAGAVLECAAEDSGTSPRDYFLNRYQESEARLAQAVHHLSGTARFLNSNAKYNRSVTNPGEMKWEELTFFKSGSSLRIDRKFPMIGTGDSTTALGSTSLVATPELSFDVIAPNSPDARTGVIARAPVGRIWAQLGVGWNQFLPATHEWFEKSLTYWRSKPGFSIVDIAALDNESKLVRIKFTWDGEGVFKNGPVPEDFVCEGYWILDPAFDWGLRKSWYSCRYSYGSPAIQEGTEEEINVTLQRLPGGEIVPKEVSVENRDPTRDGSPRLYRRVMQFTSIRTEEPTPETFSLSALGVVEPRDSGLLFVLVNAGILIIVLGFFMIRRMRRTS